ncbi:MAG: hypothetical protein WAM14_00955 [Candidatus Nitrosopolaris sp.]
MVEVEYKGGDTRRKYIENISRIRISIPHFQSICQYFQSFIVFGIHIGKEDEKTPIFSFLTPSSMP